VIASNGRDNCKGATKAEILTRMFPDGFEYAGDSAVDVSVWQVSAGRIVVNASPLVLRRVMQLGDVTAVFPRPPMRFATMRRALRLHQWAKGALVFVPLVLGGKGADPTAWMTVLIGFLALSITASATYLVNDLWDLPSDRRHWSKQHRPLAQGEISIRLAVMMIFCGILAGLGLTALTGPPALAMLVLYIAGTLAYSFGFKRIPIVDVLLLASLFTVRLGLGIVLADVRVSPWLLVFSMFLFVSLSTAKRHTEVLRLADHGLDSIAGRGYVAADAPLTLATGLAAMFGAILILVLYLTEDAFPRGIYGTPALLWAMPPILFLFLGRVWLISQRGQLRDDPVAFALKDRISLYLGLAMGIVVAAALLLRV
jgi:4-hydroxybenzoate polyprenyltransferase